MWPQHVLFPIVYRSGGNDHDRRQRGKRILAMSAGVCGAIGDPNHAMQSALVRKFALQSLSTVLAGASLRIVRAPDGPPEVWDGDRPVDIPVSLAHHGPWVAMVLPVAGQGYLLLVRKQLLIQEIRGEPSRLQPSPPSQFTGDHRVKTYLQLMGIIIIGFQPIGNMERICHPVNRRAAIERKPRYDHKARYCPAAHGR